MSLSNYEIQARADIAKRVCRDQSASTWYYTKDYFAEGLDALALQKRSQEPQMSHADAYTAALCTEAGKDLYDAYTRAPEPHTSAPEQQVSRPDSLTRDANALRQSDPSLTEPQAIAKALLGNPSLYDQYLNDE